MRRVVLIVAALGTLLFGGLLVLSYASPITLESWARLAVQHEIEARVAARTGALSQSALVRAAESAVGANNRELLAAKEALAALPAKVASVAGQMLDPECPCRLRAREFLREHLAGKVSFLNASNERLTSLIQSKYVEVAESLLREFRIFCAANALVFVFLGVVAFVKRQAGIQLLAPAFVLVVSAVVVACLYLFTQNWLQTVLLGQYVGFWYFPYLGLAVASLGDVLFNRARVTSAIVNAALSAVGGVASAVPC